MSSIWIWVCVSGFVLLNMLQRAWNPVRGDLDVIALIVGVVPSFVIFAGAIGVITGRL